MRLIILTLLICASIGLGACGQKGPLYLPDQLDAQENEKQKS